MKRSNKKGFTIVELVIVIAIIAILAAVLIPTFASLIQKANTSADIQACRQMNTYLAVNEVTADKTIVEVYEALRTGGMDAEDYKPLSSNTYYFWDAKLNRVLYTNDSYEVIYPEEYKDVKSTDADHQWYSLTTEIKGDSSYEGKGTSTISVSTGDQLYQAVKDLARSTEEITLKTASDGNPAITANFENSINEDTVINITADIDMKGASLSIGLVTKNKTLTINGNGHTIKGVCNLNEAVSNMKLNEESKERNYYSGLIKLVDKGATVTINNLRFENIVTGNTGVGSSGIIIGDVKGSATIEFNGVQIVNSVLYGKNKLGAFIGGQNYPNTVSIKKGTAGANTLETKLDNVKVICTEGESGLLFGSTSNSGTETIQLDKDLFANNYDFIKNCSVICTSSKTKDAETADGFNKPYDGKIVEKSDDPGKYRISTAYYGFSSKTTAYSGTTSKLNPINDYDQAVAAGWVWDFSGGTPTKVTQ